MDATVDGEVIAWSGLPKLIRKIDRSRLLASGIDCIHATTARRGRPKTMRHGRLIASRSCRRGYATKARDYAAAVADLNTLQSNFGIVQQIRQNRHEMNLRAIPEMVQWCRRIGYEPSQFDQFNPVHIAGTKGKGSTSSFISSILSQYLPTKLSVDAERTASDVGLYTSPHLRYVRERIQVNNKPISEREFATCFYDVWDRLEAAAQREQHPEPQSPETKPVYFRYLTLMALHHYMQKRVGTAVIECGIGGEYDSTNILVKPSVTGVTSLGIDHTAILGEDIDSIAWHKAGIFKEGVPAFTATQPASALQVLRQRAMEKGTTLEVAPLYKALETVKLGLYGSFQKINAALAVAVSAMHLQRLGYANLPDPLNPEATLPPQFVKGLEDTRLGGRCEKRSDSVKPDLTWYLDGGHTLESINLAAEWFASEVSADSDGRKVKQRILIFNQQTRDAASLARVLFDTLGAALSERQPFAHAIFCTNTTYQEQGYKADLVSINVDHQDVDTLKVQNDLARTWEGLDSSSTIHVFHTIEEAINKARSLSESRESSVFVTGSLHLVGGVTEILENDVEWRERDAG